MVLVECAKRAECVLLAAVNDLRAIEVPVTVWRRIGLHTNMRAVLGGARLRTALPRRKGPWRMQDLPARGRYAILGKSPTLTAPPRTAPQSGFSGAPSAVASRRFCSSCPTQRPPLPSRLPASPPGTALESAFSRTPAAQHATAHARPIASTCAWPARTVLTHPPAPVCYLQRHPPCAASRPNTPRRPSSAVPPKLELRASSRRLHVKIDFPAKSHDSKARPRPTSLHEAHAHFETARRPSTDPPPPPPRTLRVHCARRTPVVAHARVRGQARCSTSLARTADTDVAHQSALVDHIFGRHNLHHPAGL
jgi:hypothetical protein